MAAGRMDRSVHTGRSNHLSSLSTGKIHEVQRTVWDVFPGRPGCRFWDVVDPAGRFSGRTRPAERDGAGRRPSWTTVASQQSRQTTTSAGLTWGWKLLVDIYREDDASNLTSSPGPDDISGGDVSSQSPTD